jgi:hypothetical protein
MPPVMNKLDRAELRAQRRYITSIFEVIVECDLFRSLDISTGGVHLDRKYDDFPVGMAVEGWIALPGLAKAYAFSGEILRTEATTGNTVLRFDDIEPEMAEFIDRSVAWRLH